MKTNKKLFGSLVCLALFFIFNLQWSMQDYGLKSISLSKQVLAQDSATSWFDKVMGGITDWWDDKHIYAEYKEYKGTKREVTTTVGGTTEINIGRPGLSGSTGISNGVVIKQTEYLYICIDGKDDIFCSGSWLDSPDYINVK